MGQDYYITNQEFYPAYGLVLPRKIRPEATSKSYQGALIKMQEIISRYLMSGYSAETKHNSGLSIQAEADTRSRGLYWQTGDYILANGKKIRQVDIWAIEGS